MAISKTQGITAASLVAAIPLVWGGTATLDSRYAGAKDLNHHEQVASESMQEISLDIWYGQFFDRLDDLDESKAEGNQKLVRVYERQIQRLLAKICAAEPTFEYCDEGIIDDPE